MKHYQNRRPQKPKRKVYPKDVGLSVTVREGNVEAALRVLKKKVKRADLINEIKDRQFYQTRSEKRRIAKNKAIRRRQRNEQKVQEMMELHKRSMNHIR